MLSDVLRLLRMSLQDECVSGTRDLYRHLNFKVRGPQDGGSVVGYRKRKSTNSSELRKQEGYD